MPALTRTDISISLVGNDVSLTLAPIGLDITYTYNEVPVAVVDLKAEDITLLCDFEKYRRKKVTIKVDSTYGCIKFEGLIDGLSMYQTVGNIRLQLIVKNAFQVLKETYPRLPGLHPSSMDLFRRVEVLKFRPFSGDFFKAMNIAAAVKAAEPNKNVIEFFVGAAKNFIQSQQHIKLVSNVAPDVSPIIQIAEDLSKTTLPKALDKLNKIDTSFVSGMTLTANNSAVSYPILQSLVESSGNLFDSLIGHLANFGCVLVISNSKAYIVPEVGFLKFAHKNPIGQGEQSTVTNVIYPSQYDSLNFNDNGYRDIKACYVVSDANVTMLNNKFTSELGYYKDPDPRVTGGVLTLPLPLPIAVGSSGAYAEAIREHQKALKNKEDNVKGEIPEDKIKAQLKEAENKILSLSLECQTSFVNNWAQLKYLQSKYMDRIGSFSIRFNTNWAPAAVGTLYTRHPGTYIDFFVTSVTHRFQVSPPNSGQAQTTINFNCGRMGKLTEGSGMDKVALYDYDGEKSAKFAAEFVASNNLLEK